MGLPSGVLWAPFNVDASEPLGFSLSQLTYSASFVSWGNKDTHNPTGDTSFAPWSWGASNSSEPYASSPGASLITIDIENDVARAVCGGKWRMPTSDEFNELLSNCDFVDAQGETIEGDDKRITIEGISVVRLKSRINGNFLIFPICGSGTNAVLSGKGTTGSYWSSRRVGSSGMAQSFRFHISDTTQVNGAGRYLGATVRPVCDVT